MKKVAVISVVVILLGLIGLFLAPKITDRTHNSLYPEAEHLRNFTPPPLHQKLFVADMHADTLLWNRDLLKESSYGHLDIPRMIKGNVALQGFSIVTKTPRGLNIDHNTADTDNITLLAIAQRWPIATWNSLSERVLYQARTLKGFADRSEGKLTLITNQGDLRRYLKRRQTEPHITAGFISIEGSQALEGDLSKLDTLYSVGVRMIAPTHFFDTEFAGSAHGISHEGLTALGVRWLYAVEKRHMIVDLAHASAKTIDDVLARATRPMVVSHTGVKAICDNNRNLSDDQLKRLAARGALVGIGFWQEATCGKTVNDIVRSILHAISVMGADHVALGSDFDGYVKTPIDTSEIGAITDGLLKAGLDEDSVRKVMGENVLRFLEQNLPES